MRDGEATIPHSFYTLYFKVFLNRDFKILEKGEFEGIYFHFLLPISDKLFFFQREILKLKLRLYEK